jgi:hypothetical protein
MAREETPVYKCTQLELYSICETATSNLEANLTVFADYKTKYTAGFVADLKTSRTAAMALPDMDVRDAVSETLRVEMVPFAANCVKYFQYLKGYIDDAFAADLRVINYKAAGLDEYEGARLSNWEDMIGMNLKMNAFITANTALLTSAGFMPATFASNVTTATDGFATKYAAFKIARQTSENTAAKIKANNVLYKNMMDFMADGQMLFSNKEEMKKLFTFSVLKSLVSPPGSASLKVVVKNADTTPAVGINISMKLVEGGGTALKGVTDANGEFLFEGIDAGVYAVAIEYNPTQNYTKEVNTGVAARLETVKS